MNQIQKRPMYTYQVRVCPGSDRERTSDNLHTMTQVAEYVNEVFGYDVISTHMLYNYYNRRHLCNKRLFNKRIFVKRTRNNISSNITSSITQTSSCPGECNHHSSGPANLPDTICA
jgi:hypothetical protein